MPAGYKAEWDEAYGKSHRRICRIKKNFMKIPDRVFNRAAQSLTHLPPAKLTMGRVAFTTLWQSPLSLWKMRGLLGK